MQHALTYEYWIKTIFDLERSCELKNTEYSSKEERMLFLRTRNPCNSEL